MKYKDLNKQDRTRIGLHIRRLAMSRAVAQLCLYLGVTKLEPDQEKELLEIMRDNFERMDPNRLWLDYTAAKRLQISMVEASMRDMQSEELIKAKYRGPFSHE